MNPLGIATVSQLKYVVFDIETTGFSKTNDRIIQIAAIKVDGKGLSKKLLKEVLKSDPKEPKRNDEIQFNAFINPGRKIPKKITDLTGITNSMVRNKPKEETILKEFKKFIGDRILVAHNGIRFDVPFIEQTANRNNIKLDNLLCLDTLLLSKKLDSDESKHSMTVLITRHNLSNRIPNAIIGQQHNAFVDVVMTAELMRMFFAKLKTDGKDRLLILTD